MLRLRRSAFTVFPVLLAGAACGGDTPTAPAPPPPVANVRALANLSFPSCGLGGCTYQGLIINDGPDCATNVRGVTHLFDSDRTEIEAQQWSVPNRMRLAEQVLYSGCCFRQSNANAPGTYRTDVFFDAVKCL